MKIMLNRKPLFSRQPGVLAAVLFAASASALTVSDLPASSFADTEVSTNVAITAWNPRTRLLELSLALDATPSNNVEAALGAESDAVPGLADEETGLAFGWDCGTWFIASDAVTNRFTAESSASGTRRELALAVRLGEDGIPRELTATENGVPLVFAGLDGQPAPAWLFSADWDTLAVAARGVAPSGGSVSFTFGTLAAILLLR